VVTRRRFGNSIQCNCNVKQCFKTSNLQTHQAPTTSTILLMKEFSLFFGDLTGSVVTRNVTNDPKYKHVVETVSQIRGRLLNDQTFRTPILSLFQGIYEEELKESTPPVDHSNFEKIREIHSHSSSPRPSDDDIVEFLTKSFPDLYLTRRRSSFNPKVLLLGENDRGVHEKLKKERSQGEEIMIGVHFVRIWLETSVSVKFIQYVHGG
jgi:hypothetical protein